MKSLFMLILAVPLVAAPFVLAANATSFAPPPDESFLDQLVGTWDMDGRMGDKPVHYIAIGERVMNNGWIDFHMQDRNEGASAYEAHVFLSADDAKHDFIAHWLDRFGAAGARVVGTGTREGHVLHLIFPYAEGAFRNTWTLDPAKDEWTLLIEAQAGNGWRQFASYQLHQHVTR